MKLVLIGYMGSGKSFIGKFLANALGCEFIDLDTHIELAEEKPISQIFEDEGEIYFRKKENQMLKNIFFSETNVVVATGGGTPCYGDSMEFLLNQEEAVTIYLKASLDVLTNRLFLDRINRPLIAHIDRIEILMDFIRKHLFERSFYYNQSSLTIDVENSSVDEVVKKIISELF